MNYRIMGRLLGILLAIEAVFMIPAVGISLYDKTSNATNALMITIVILLIVGGALIAISNNAKKQFYAKEGFVTVALGWIVLSAAGAIPFYMSGEIPSYVDAFFETVSGFTTTGASILTNVEGMSRGLLYWRSFTHWLGGMGILVFLLAVIPASKGGTGHSMHLLRAESPGPSVGKLVPKMAETAKILYSIYVLLTILCVIFLEVGGMGWFDSVCTAFGAAGTGGFGTKNDSMASFSPYLQTVVTVFMALFGINFNIYFLLLIRRWKDALFDEELRVYLSIMFGSIALITINTISHYGKGVGYALHHAAFTVSSIMTTTGYATVDFDLWPQFSRTLLCLLMICGASAGSTGGGIKSIRLILLVKHLGREIKKMLRPRSVSLVRINGRSVDESVLNGVNIFMAAYCAILGISLMLISLDNQTLETNLTAVLACLNNIGPGLGMVGPTQNYSHFSDFSKLILSLNMLIGRLEIFPILILLSRSTWKRIR